MATESQIKQFHAHAFLDAQEHAERCRRCCIPIMDQEGNPGYFGEACEVGARILLRYVNAEKALLARAWE